jgi:hypothetical protein
MSDPIANQSRRRFIQLSAFGLAALPLSNLLASGYARAADMPKVDENDPTAKNLSYVQDATKADPAKRGAAAADHFCKNCQLYTGKAGDEWGPCTIFQGKLVNANGWCSAWAKKAG